MLSKSSEPMIIEFSTIEVQFHLFVLAKLCSAEFLYVKILRLLL
jgi:hypothetical protein